VGTGGLAVAAAGVYGLANPDPDGVLFPGWQLTTARIALLVLGLLVAGPCVVVLARRLPSPYRWALLPALLLGILVARLTWSAFDPVLRWASDQTTAAAEFRRVTAANPRSPHISHTGHPVAAPAIAALLLRPDLLGPGWFDVFEPNPTNLPSEPSHSASYLVKAHHDQGRWTTDALCFEGIRLFSSAVAAQDWLTHQRTVPESVLHRRVIAGVVVDVWEAKPPRKTRSASFRRGNRVWTMLISPELGATELTSHEADAVIAAAVRRSAG
jgi:hypothetical protein